MPAPCTLDKFNKIIEKYEKKCLTEGNKNVIVLCLRCKQTKTHKRRDLAHFRVVGLSCKNCNNLALIKAFKVLIKKEKYSLIGIKHLRCRIACRKCKTEKNVPAGHLNILKCKKCRDEKKSKKLLTRAPRPEALRNIKIRGGKFIRKEVINSVDMSRKKGKNAMYLLVKCANNHEFMINEYSLIKGRYCRLCSTGMAESVFRIALNTFTDHEFFSTYIKTENGKYQLDAFCPKLKFNIEIHGVQHYEYHKFFHENYSDFLKQQAHDKKKVAFLENQGIKCYSVTDKEVTKSMRDGTLKDLVITYLKNTRKNNLIPKDIDSRVLDLTLFFKNRVFADSFISIKKKYPGQNIWDLIEYKKRDKIRENRKTKSGDGYNLIQK